MRSRSKPFRKGSTRQDGRHEAWHHARPAQEEAVDKADITEKHGTDGQDLATAANHIAQAGLKRFPSFPGTAFSIHLHDFAFFLSSS